MIGPAIRRAGLALAMGITIALPVQGVAAQSPAATAPNTSPTPTPGPGTLAIQFPAQVDGQPLFIRSLTGQELLDAVDPTDPAVGAAVTGLTDELTAMGRSIDDLDVAWATLSTDAGTVAISAIRLGGSDGLALREALMPLFTGPWADARRADVTVADKATIELTDGDPAAATQWLTLYAVDDTVWAVNAPEPERSAILGALP